MPMLGVKGLLLRVALAIAISIGFGVAIGFWIAGSAESALRSERVDRLLTAMEVGPLQMARLQSKEITTAQLKALLEASNKPEPLFLSAAIVSGPNQNDVSAEWKFNSPLTSESCTSFVTREKSFSDAMFPYYLTIHFDNCVHFSGIAQLKVVFVFLNICTAFLVLTTIWFGMIPVTRSIASAIDLLNRGIAPFRSKLPFAPLEELLATAERVLRAEKDAALTHVTQQLIHDLKTPLVAFEQIAFVKSWDDFEMRKNALQNSLVRLHAMVDALRRNELELIICPSACEFSLLNLTNELVPFAAERGVKLESKSQNSVFLELDLSKFERALMNLIRNAVESGARNVTAEFEVLEDMVRFSVCDNGPGVPDDLLPLLFERGTSFGKVGGTGLGLSYSRSIVRGHGGDLQYQRKSDITTFTFCIKKNTLNASIILDDNISQNEQKSFLGASIHNRLESDLVVHCNLTADVLAVISELQALGFKANVYNESKQNNFEIIYVSPNLVTDKILAVGKRVVLAKLNEGPKAAALRLSLTLKTLSIGKKHEEK